MSRFKLIPSAHSEPAFMHLSYKDSSPWDLKLLPSETGSYTWESFAYCVSRALRRVPQEYHLMIP